MWTRCFFSMGEKQETTLQTILLTHYVHLHKIPLLLVSTTIKKVFDCREVFMTFQRMSLGSNMLSKIMALYKQPPIDLCNGTRQSCPLFPFFFFPFTRAFLSYIALHHNNNIKRLHSVQTDHKLVAFADRGLHSQNQITCGIYRIKQRALVGAAWNRSESQFTKKNELHAVDGWWSWRATFEGLATAGILDNQ